MNYGGQAGLYREDHCALPVQLATTRGSLKAVVHANSCVAATRQENRRDAYSTLARGKVA